MKRETFVNVMEDHFYSVIEFMEYIDYQNIISKNEDKEQIL